MRMRLWLLLLSTSLFLTANRPLFLANQARITIQLENGQGQPVGLSTPDVFTREPIELREAKLDASGKAMLDIPLTRTQFVNVKVGEKISTLLISPGDDLHISISAQKTSPVVFSGKGAEAATFLAKTAMIWQSYETKGGKYLFQLDPNEFASRLDSVQKAYNELAQRLLPNTVKPIRHLLVQRNAMQLLTYKLMYAIAQFDPDDSSQVLPPSLRNVVHEVPFEASLLNANMYEYGFALSLYLQYAFYYPAFSGKTKEESRVINEQLPQLVDQQLILKSYPVPIRAFLRAANLNISLSGQGLTPTVKAILETIKKEPDYHLYASVIQKKYDSWSALLPGKVAPDFSGMTPDGKPLSLADLKGKIVYVDVWATWCGPCREEFPQAKQLQAQFADNKQVAFLYVSIDNNLEAWKKMLANDPDFKGAHINQAPGEQRDSFWKAYQLSGVPRYILIDQAGNLVSANADRPSSGKVAEAIQRLLQ